MNKNETWTVELDRACLVWNDKTREIAALPWPLGSEFRARGFTSDYGAATFKYGTLSKKDKMTNLILEGLWLSVKRDIPILSVWEALRSIEGIAEFIDTDALH